MMKTGPNVRISYARRTAFFIILVVLVAIQWRGRFDNTKLAPSRFFRLFNNTTSSDDHIGTTTSSILRSSTNSTPTGRDSNEPQEPIPVQIQLTVPPTAEAKSKESFNTTDSVLEKIVRSRFPIFGSKEFEETCRWTLNNEKSHLWNCTIHFTPNQNTEGMSAWLAVAGNKFLVAQQAQCRLLMDYGSLVDISQVIVPPKSGLDEMDWRVTDGFECRKEDNCIATEGHGFLPDSPLRMWLTNVTKNQAVFADLPVYRWPYTTKGKWFNDFIKHDGFKSLRDTRLGIDGSFTLQSGLACSLGRLLALSPSASKYIPNLFTTILPTLRDTQNVVLALYIRTLRFEARFDRMHPDPELFFRRKAQPILDCALELEEYVRQRDQNRNKFVWLVVTDAPYLQTYVRDTYENQTAARTILITNATGTHSKTINHPDTTVFAETFLDWYLMGESNAIISDNSGPSFGATAGFRTLRPNIKVGPVEKEDEDNERFHNYVTKSCRLVETYLKW